METVPNGKVDRIRAWGSIVLAMGTIAAIVVLIAYNVDNTVAQAIAGGLVVVLKDIVHLFDDETKETH